MRKLKLSLDDLEVSTFIPQGRAVYGMDSWPSFLGTCGPTLAQTCPQTQQTRCLCTDAEGCYPSLYCSGAGPGEPNNTCYDGCMTNENGAC